MPALRRRSSATGYVSSRLGWMARRKILIDSLRSVPQDALTYHETAVALRRPWWTRISPRESLTSLGEPDEALKHL